MRKKVFDVTLFLGLLAALSSCEQEIDINAPWEDVTVVYSLLDPGSNVNWVRVERGYLGREPARFSFNEPDSLYYDTLQVYLYGINNNGDTLDNRLLTKDQSVNLDSGTFTTEDFRLYRTNGKLNDALRYYLRIIKPGTGFEETRAETELIEPNFSTTSGFRFQEPFPFDIRRPLYNGRIAWFDSDDAAMYEVDIYFHYIELDTATNIVSSKSFKIDYETRFGPFSTSSSPLESNKGRQELYQAIAANVPVNDRVLRFYDKMRIVIWAGGEDLRRYIQLNEPTSGLNQTKPEFNQIENGTGLFSSRTRIAVDNVDLAGGTGGVKNTYYLDPVLCDRNFAIATTGDTCYCEFLGSETNQVCF